MSKGGCWQHLKMYGAPEDGPQLILDTVDELEFHLRLRFPGVFQAAEERRMLEEWRALKQADVLPPILLD